VQQSGPTTASLSRTPINAEPENGIRRDQWLGTTAFPSVGPDYARSAVMLAPVSFFGEAAFQSRTVRS
jgi:hypothetical protein